MPKSNKDPVVFVTAVLEGQVREGDGGYWVKPHPTRIAELIDFDGDDPIEELFVTRKREVVQWLTPLRLP